MNGRNILIFIMAIILLSTLGCSQSNDSTNENDETQVAENMDAELKIAITSQPTTLDVHTTGDALTRDVAIHIYETLITLNADYQPVPMLAESVEKSEDGKTYTFKLREGVQFHNGKEMKAEDVLASMNRWKERSTIAQEHLHDATFEAQDDYTVVLQLQNPRLDLLDLLAGQDFFPAIMPKEIIEDAGDDFVKEYVGTGPFQFVDWLQDQYVHLARFDDYTFDDSPANGLAGKKEALVKDLYFYKTQDPSTLLTGLQTGEFDIAYSIAFDHYDQVKNDPNFNVYSAYFGTMNLVYNKREGLFSDVKMRQAVNAALNASDIMLGAFANEELYGFGSSYMNEKVVNWYSEAGQEGFNQNNTEKAKQLLEEAGYNGEEITLLSNRDIPYHYDIAVIVQEQLNQLGMNVNLEVFDWAAHIERRDDPDYWDIVTAGINYPAVPSTLVSLAPNWPGWTDDTKIAGLLEEIISSDSLSEGKEKWDELQGYAWTEYVPFTQFGSVPIIMAAKSSIEGLQVMDRPIMMPLWNTKVNGE